MKESLVSRIDQILPQTQCGECQTDGCRPYAEAMVHEGAEINRCPPGGTTVLFKLADLLQRNPKPFIDEVEKNTRKPATAIIREDACIGCTKCIQACPVDAIIGTAKQMHVILSDECTGCGLCIEPCPMDCIDLIPLSEPAYNPDLARSRHQARLQRQTHEQAERRARHLRAQGSRQDYLQALLKQHETSTT